MMRWSIFDGMEGGKKQKPATLLRSYCGKQSSYLATSLINITDF